MKIAQKYSHAVTSSNLKSDTYHHDADTLAAVALGGGEFGSLLFRVKYSNDSTSFHSLLEKFTVVVESKAILRKWNSSIRPEQIASAALKYWLNDLCWVCEGRGYPVVLGTPMLSDKECSGCHGTGKKVLDANSRELDYIKDMVEALEEMARHAGSAAIKKLAGEFDL